MSNSALASLELKDFRGCADRFCLPFAAGKTLTVIYGPNGSGKTTLCDALDFLGNGQVGSIEGRSGGLRSHWPSLGADANSVEVTLRRRDGSTCRGRIAGQGVEVTPEANRPRVRVLRRAQVLKLVTAQPAKRYKVIEGFFGLTAVEDSEKQLNVVLQRRRRERDAAAARLAEDQRALDERRATTAEDPSSEAPPGSGEAEADLLDEASTLLTAVLARASRWCELSGEIDQASTRFTNSEAAVDAAQAGLAGDAPGTIRLLEAAAAQFDPAAPPPACPLCGSEDRAAGLVGRVGERLQKLQHLVAALGEREEARAGLERLAAVRERMRPQAEDDRAAWRALGRRPWPAAAAPPGDPPPEDGEALIDWCESRRPAAAAWSQAAATRRREQATRRSLAAQQTRLDRDAAALAALDRGLDRLATALKISREERRAFTDAALARVSDRVANLYGLVHPGEEGNLVRLTLDPAQRASLLIEFAHGELGGQPPHAYFSESHLDTLGLCIFLASAGMEHAAETVLVLDDAVASVDEAHAERVVEMLYEEGARFAHCLMTTHHKPWREMISWGHLRDPRCELVEMKPAGVGTGLRTTKSVPDPERLRSLLAEDAPDVQLICAKAGVVLEALLNFLTLQYRCAVPRTPDDRHTLRPLLDAISKKKLRPRLRVEVLGGGGHPAASRDLGPLLDDIESIAQARNLMGCHFNQIAYLFSDEPGLRFGRLVLELGDLLICPAAGWPLRDAGTHWATRGDTRRLYPLKRPG